MDSLVSQGINLAVYGMGTVFLFLTLLIFATGLMSYLVTRFSAEKSDADASNDLDLPPAEPNQHTIAIITAALREHRRISAERRS
jgi:oxaloacetate decarboxylase gamma subunit